MLLVIGFGLPDSLDIFNGDLIAASCDKTTQAASSKPKFILDRMEFTPVLLTMGRRRLTSSGSAGTLETQEMLNFCSKHNIAADVEVISAADINEGFERLEQGDVYYRLVIDMATLKAPDGDKAKS